MRVISKTWLRITCCHQLNSLEPIRKLVIKVTSYWTIFPLVTTEIAFPTYHNWCLEHTTSPDSSGAQWISGLQFKKIICIIIVYVKKKKERQEKELDIDRSNTLDLAPNTTKKKTFNTSSLSQINQDIKHLNWTIFHQNL